MRLLFRQRMFSWFDSYDIYDENGNTVYVVKGQLSWGHLLNIYDAYENKLGCISKEFTFFKPKYNIDFNGWQVEGNWLEWDYTILRSDGGVVATISKELLHMTDTYVLDIQNPKDALHVLMFVLAMDAEKCSRN